jgi:hypothetical protein
MHPRILAQRSATAQQRMLVAAETLAREFGLSDDLLVGLRVQTGDPEVRRMQEREAMAAVLDAVVNYIVPPKPAPVFEAPTLVIEHPDGNTITVEAAVIGLPPVSVETAAPKPAPKGKKK